MEFIAILLIIYTISIPISNFIKRKIEMAIPIAVISMTLIVYISGLFNNLSIGVKVIELIAIGVAIYNCIYIIRNIRNKQIKLVLKRIVTPGLLVYVALFLIFIIINHGRIFEDYDEFSHWGTIVKNMFFYNQYGTMENSVVTFNEYPPFIACFQYILLKIKGIYSEDLIIIALNLLYLSIIIPICEKTDFDKNYKNLLFIIPAILLAPLMIFANFFIHILVDGFLGILFSVGLFIIYKNDENKKYKNIMLMLIITALVLTKTTGILFAVLLIIFEFINSLIQKECTLKEISKKILVILIIPVILIIAWYVKININNTYKEWDLEKVVTSENDEEFTETVTKSYLKAFFEKKEINIKGLSLASSILILGAFSIYVYKIVENKKQYIYILIATIISVVIFYFGLLWMYLTIFPKDEAIILSCYDRYIATIVLTWLMLNILVICDSNKINLSLIYVFIIITITILPDGTIKEKYIQNKEYKNMLYVKRNYYTRNIKKYEDILNEDDKIFLISNEAINNLHVLRMIKYELMNINIANYDPMNIGTKEEFTKELLEENYTHVYVYKLKEALKEEYKEIFEKNEIMNETLYEINTDEKGNLKLERVKI